MTGFGKPIPTEKADQSTKNSSQSQKFGTIGSMYCSSRDFNPTYTLTLYNFRIYKEIYFFFLELSL